MKYFIRIFFILIGILSVTTGCRIVDYSGYILGSDNSYVISKSLLYDGTSSLYFLHNQTYASKAYSLEQIDLNTGVRTTVVGSGASAYTDGIGVAALLGDPRALAFKSGSPSYLYIGDGCSIRKIDTSSWQVTTIAGVPATCSDTDGTGTATARFNYVYSLEVVDNNLYIGTQSRIRKMDLTTLQVTTLAGQATLGFADGIGTAAQFYYPTAINHLNSNLYIVDKSNRRIRKLRLADNDVSTFAGSGTSGSTDGIGTAATFAFSGNADSEMTNDGVNLLFVTDTANCVVRKIDLTTAEVTKIFTKGSSSTCFDLDGPLGTANLSTYHPTGIAFSSFGLFIANDWGVRVLK